MMIINSVIIVVLGYFSSGQISQFILKDSSFSNIIFYCFLISAFEALLVLPMSIARINSKPVLYTIINVSNLLLNLSLQLYFIYVLNSEFGFIFLAKFIAPAVIFVLCIPYVLKNIQFEIDFTEIKNILRFSFPMMLAMLMSMLLNSVDRFILADFVTKQEVAVYTIGYSIGSVTNAFILAPFTLAMNVIFWKKINDDNFTRFMTKSSTYLFTVMIFVSVIITFILPYAIKIFVKNDLLWSSMYIIPFILFSNCFLALFIFPSQDLYHKRKTHVIMYIVSVCLLFNVIANILLIKYFGIYAAAGVTVLSSLLMIIIAYKIVKGFTFTKFELAKIILLSFIFLINAYLSFQFQQENIYLDVIIKLLLIFLSILILYVFRFFEPVEKESIKGFFNKYLFRIFNKNT